MSSTMFIGSMSAYWLRDELVNFMKLEKQVWKKEDDVRIDDLWFGLQHLNEVTFYSQKDKVIKTNLPDYSTRDIFFSYTKVVDGETTHGVVGVSATFDLRKIEPIFVLIGHEELDKKQWSSIRGYQSHTLKLRSDVALILPTKVDMVNANKFSCTTYYYIDFTLDESDEHLEPIYRVEEEDELFHLISYKNLIPKHLLPVLFGSHEDKVKHGREWQLYKKNYTVAKPYLDKMSEHGHRSVNILVSPMEELREYVFIDIVDKIYNAKNFVGIRQHDLYMYKKSSGVLESIQDRTLTYEDFITNCMGKFTISYFDEPVRGVGDGKRVRKEPYIVFNQIRVLATEVCNFNMIVPENIVSKFVNDSGSVIEYERMLDYRVGNYGKPLDAMPFFKKYAKMFTELEGVVLKIEEDRERKDKHVFTVLHSPINTRGEEVEVELHEDDIDHLNFRDLMKIETVTDVIDGLHVQTVTGRVKCFISGKGRVGREKVTISRFITVDFELKKRMMAVDPVDSACNATLK